jgi:hypothetical protein
MRSSRIGAATPDRKAAIELAFVTGRVGKRPVADKPHACDLAEMMTPSERFERLGLTSWDTEQVGELRSKALPHAITADYDGTPVVICFGAFIGWPQCDADVGSMLRRPEIARAHILNISHQAAGTECLGAYFFAAPVRMKDRFVEPFAEICRAHYHAETQVTEPESPEREIELQIYRARLAEIGLTAETAFSLDSRGLIESVYPMDATPENIATFLAEPSELLTALAPLLTDQRFRERMRIYVLCDNSD